MENLFCLHEPQQVRIDMGIHLTDNEIKVLPILRVLILGWFLVISCSKILWVSYFTMKSETTCVEVQCSYLTATVTTCHQPGHCFAAAL